MRLENGQYVVLLRYDQVKVIADGKQTLSPSSIVMWLLHLETWHSLLCGWKLLVNDAPRIIHIYKLLSDHLFLKLIFWSVDIYYIWFIRITCFPVAPAPVYAIKHLVVAISQSLTNESFPEDNTYLPTNFKITH